MYAGLGEKDEALRSLDKAVDLPNIPEPFCDTPGGRAESTLRFSVPLSYSAESAALRRRSRSESSF